jgi:ribonuclease VapC
MVEAAAESVLDASALLAFFQDELGSETVEQALGESTFMSVVTYADVLTRLADAGEEPTAAHERLRAQGLIDGLIWLLPFTEEDAVTVALLRPATRAHGLSFSDRACLAAGLRLGRPVLTADRLWATISVRVSVRLIRP